MEEADTQLELNIISAQDLKEVHCFGMMQTYCVVWINFEKKVTTQIDRIGGANPTWNDKVIFRVEDHFLRSETSAVMVEIYCVGCLRDTLIGTVRVLLSTFLKGYGSTDFSGVSFSAQQVRRPSGRRPQGILNLGTVILDGVDFHRMSRFNPATGGAVDFRDLMGNPVQPRASFVKKFLFIKPNNVVVVAQEQHARCQGFNNLACKEEGRDQEKRKNGDKMAGKKEKKKPVGCYQILMASKLKKSKVGLRNGAAKIHLSPSDSNFCVKGDQDPALVNQDEMVEKKEKKKPVGCYHILMVPILKRNKVGLMNGAARFQGSPFDSDVCLKRDQDLARVKQDEMVEKKEKKKPVSCYHILMAPKLKRNKVGLRNGSAKIYRSHGSQAVHLRVTSVPVPRKIKVLLRFATRQ